MQFNVKDWRRYYDKIHRLGRMLKNSKPYMDDEKNWHSAIIDLTEEQQKDLEKQIKHFTRKSDEYLASCDLKSKMPLWKYDNNDTSTWVSSPNFRFSHRIR